MSNKKGYGYIGCLGGFVIVIVIGGSLAYFFLIRPVMSGLDTFSEIHQTNERIENRDPYDPPTTGELEKEQVERFVSVQRTIRDKMEQRLSDFEEQYEEISDDWQQQEPSFRKALAAWSELGELYADAKQVQVEALNEEGFSLQEYRFVQSTFYQTLGFELLPYNVNSIAEAASKGDLRMDLEEFRDQQKEIPEETLRKNRELVADHTNEAEEWLVFAWWGL